MCFEAPTGSSAGNIYFEKYEWWVFEFVIHLSCISQRATTKLIVWTVESFLDFGNNNSIPWTCVTKHISKVIVSLFSVLYNGLMYL